MSEDIIELVGMLIILTLMISGVQWFLVRYIHWSIALVATGLISLVASFLYVSLSHATPNGGSNSPDVSEFITPMLVIFGSLLCGLTLICYMTQNQLPRIAYMLPLSFIILFAIGRHVYQYVDAVTFYSKMFSSCKIKVLNETMNRAIVEEINFYSASSSIVNTIHSNSNEKYDSSMPRFATKIIFRCNSTKTNSLFEQDFPFDYNMCKEKEGGILGYCFWLQEKVILPIKIVLKPHNKVDLYIDNRLVKQYQLNDL